jgi:arylformamidase
MKPTRSSCWIDISVPLYSGMVHWPGDRPVRIRRTQQMVRGDACNLSSLSMSSHVGTHVDAPRHCLRRGKTIDELRFGALIGPARVVAIEHPKAIAAEELRPARVGRGERILFKTRNSKRCWNRDRFVSDFVYLAKDAARLLAERGVLCVGIDYLSIDRTETTEVHRLLLGAGVWIIEGLNLSAVKPGSYELVCLPLRIQDGDGAPARAILRPTTRA